MVLFEFLEVIVSLLSLHPDSYLNSTEVAIKYGFFAVDHYITTSDGYINNLVHISKKPFNISSQDPVLIISHGYSGSSDTMVHAALPYSPALYFASKGFDVWLLNTRGNMYSRNHKTYKLDSYIYWNFTFEEIGKYDNPAFIDYILNYTNHKAFHFLGHSQGATSMMAALTMNPNYYINKLLSVTLWGPPIKMEKLKSPLLKFIHDTYLLDILTFFGIYEFAEYTPLISRLNAFLMQAFPAVFGPITRMISDAYPETIDFSRAPILLSRYPQGGSWKGLKHIFQLFENQGFFRYRESKKDMLMKYEIKNTPASIPIFIVGGQGDLQGDPIGGLYLYKELIKAGKNANIKIYDKLGHLGMLCPSKIVSGHLDDTYKFIMSYEKA